MFEKLIAFIKPHTFYDCIKITLRKQLVGFLSMSWILVALRHVNVNVYKVYTSFYHKYTNTLPLLQ